MDDDSKPEPPKISLEEWLAENPADNDKPFSCSKCGCRRSTVIKTQNNVTRGKILRRRRCDYCAHKFYTTEGRIG